MNKLQVLSNEENKVIDSREVAEMMNKEHKQLMKEIRAITLVLERENFSPSDYYIQSTYINAQNKKQPCYMVTKMGCDMLGNKLQGEKGILFTARYVKRFNDMEKQIEKTLLSFQIEDPIERAKAWITEQEQARLLIAKKDEIIEELSPLAKLARERMDKTGTVSFTDMTRTYELKRGQISAWAKANGYIHKTIQEVNDKGLDYFKCISDTVGHKNIAIKDEGIKLIDKNIEEIKVSPCIYRTN